MENKLFELSAARRSIRKYTSEHISDEILHEIMKVALSAPCSFGHRPVEFVVVRDKIHELAACKSLGGGEFWIEDGAIASSYILLAAEQYNLGACWVHIRNRSGRKKSSDEEIRDLLGIPDGYAVLNLIALGGKGETKRAYREEDFDFGKIHYENY